MSDAIRIRARAVDAVDAVVEVLLLMPHPMETGLRKGDGGAFVPAHFITELRVTAEGRVVLQARLSQAVSQDPLLTFRYRGGRLGDRIEVSWTDSRGDTRSGQARVG